MRTRTAMCLLFVFEFCCGRQMIAQRTAPTSELAWHSKEERELSKRVSEGRPATWRVDAQKVYTLPELVDLAQRHNPETRAEWERARVRADELGVAQSAYLPTLAASVLGASARQPALIGEFLHRQTSAVFSPTLRVEYLIFDFGGRAGEIDIARANLLIQNLQFNEIHRQVIFRVAASYFQLMSAQGQREAAEINLKNADTVEAEAEGRLQNGLSTRPDLLEATAARLQADYELQAAVGAEKITKGALASSMGLPPDTEFQVQSMSEMPLPALAVDSLKEEITRAIEQRPQITTALAKIRLADGALKEARSGYFPKVSFAGNGGLSRGYAQQDLYPGHYGEGESWSASLSMRWTLFDGAAREYRVAAAKALRNAAQADLHSVHDQVELEVFTSYTSMQTAVRQQQAASALLTASTLSYASARESYSLGLRSQLDVISAQKTLAEARYEEVAARSRLLLQVADLAFRTGDMIQRQGQVKHP